MSNLAPQLHSQQFALVVNDPLGDVLKIPTLDSGLGIDLCDGYEPKQIASFVAKAAPEGADLREFDLRLLEACFHVSQVYEFTRGGLEDVVRRKMRMYSFNFVDELMWSVLEADGKLARVIAAIHFDAVDAVASKTIATLLTAELFTDIAFLRVQVPALPVGYVAASLERLSELLTGVPIRWSRSSTKGLEDALKVIGREASAKLMASFRSRIFLKPEDDADKRQS
jgi:hypothetical protein